MSVSPRMMICFDLGGVLARIRRNWQACAAAVNVEIGLPANELYDLSDFPLFDPFQFGSIDPSKYLEDLGGYLSVSSADALKVHNAILDRPYEGTHRLIRDLAEAGHRRSCLSNTNSLHWAILNSHSFPGILELDFKLVSQDIKLLKPDPMIFRLFDLKAETLPDRVIYFDDHEGNVKAAQRHGWNAFLIDHQGDTAAQMRAALAESEVLPKSTLKGRIFPKSS